MTRVVHCKRSRYDVYIGRPSRWGNPFKTRMEALVTGRGKTEPYYLCDSREEAVSRFRDWLRGQPQLVWDARRELRGRVLGCWCKPLLCHGDVWVEICDGVEDSEVEGMRCSGGR